MAALGCTSGPSEAELEADLEAEHATEYARAMQPTVDALEESWDRYSARNDPGKAALDMSNLAEELQIKLRGAEPVPAPAREVHARLEGLAERAVELSPLFTDVVNSRLQTPGLGPGDPRLEAELRRLEDFIERQIGPSQSELHRLARAARTLDQ